MFRKTSGNAIKCLAFLGLAAFATPAARAGFTQVNPAGDSELGHAAILSATYGGSFHASGLNFVGNGMTAKRLDDTTGGTAGFMNLVLGTGGSDQCWTNGVVSARAIARFAGYEQTLGVIPGETGGTFQNLFTVSGYGVNVQGSVSGLDLTGNMFRFARGGGGEMFTSLDIDNFGAMDQMVSYCLTGPNGLRKYLLFFEDAGIADNSDYDFNDMVIEITANAPTAVPLPPAIWSGLAVLLTGGLWNARTRVRGWFK